MALSTGSFIYVIARDLIPNTLNTLKRKGNARKHIIALILGILIMIGIGALVPHTHSDGHTDDHEETEYHE
jgi:zinc transporter ZupT